LSYPDNNKKPVKSNAMKKAEEAVREYRMSNKLNQNQNEHSNIQSDVLGSYTGMSYDGGEPDQDADDL